MSDSDNVEQIGNFLRTQKKKIQHYNEQEIEEIFRDFEMGPKIEEFYKDVARGDPDFLEKIQKNMTSVYKKEIRYIIHRDKNTVNLIGGPQGGGKSRLGIGLLKNYEDIRLEEMNQIVHHHFTFSPSQLQSLFPKVDDGDFIQSDEWPRMSGANARVILDKLANLIDQLRATHKCVNICTPEIVDVEGLSNLFVPFGHYKKFYETKDPNDMISRALWYHCDELKTSKKRFVLMGVIYIDMSKTEDIWQEYLKYKMENIKRLEKNRGGSGVGREHYIFLEALGGELLEFALSQGWPEKPKNPSKKKLLKYILQMGLTGLTKRDESVLQDIVVDTYKDQRRKEEQEEEEEEDSDLKFEFDLSKPFKVTRKMENAWLKEIRAKSESPKIDRNIKLYKKCSREIGTTFEDITLNSEFRKDFRTKQRAEQIYNNILFDVLQIRGNRYELYLKPKLEEFYDEVIHIGGYSKPDFLLKKGDDFIFLSVKCMKFSADFSLSYTEHRAEIKAARKMYKDQKIISKVAVHLYNLDNFHVYCEFIPLEYIINPKKKLEGKNHQIEYDKYTY